MAGLSEDVTGTVVEATYGSSGSGMIVLRTDTEKQVNVSTTVGIPNTPGGTDVGLPVTVKFFRVRYERTGQTLSDACPDEAADGASISIEQAGKTLEEFCAGHVTISHLSPPRALPTNTASVPTGPIPECEFRGLKIGTPPSAISGLVSVPIPKDIWQSLNEQARQEDKLYRRPADDLGISGGKLDSITYNFHKGALSGITIEAVGPANVQALFTMLEAQYGLPQRCGGLMEGRLGCVWPASRRLSLLYIEHPERTKGWTSIGCKLQNSGDDPLRDESDNSAVSVSSIRHPRSPTIARLAQKWGIVQGLSQDDFTAWILSRQTIFGEQFFSDVGITDQTLSLWVPDSRRLGNLGNMQQFADIADAFVVWCGCEGHTRVGLDMSYLGGSKRPLYEYRFNPVSGRSQKGFRQTEQASIPSDRQEAKSETARTTTSQQPALPLGMYRVVRDAELLSEAREDAESVASLSKDMKVRVVGSIGGQWLEVQSKRADRPSGYLRADQATPIAR